MAKKKTTKKAAAKKATKKAAAKKTTKKATAKKATKKAAAKKTTKKAATKKAATKKTTAKKATKKAAAKTTKKAAKKAKPAKKRKPNAAFMAPYTPSADLAVVVGSKPLSRPDVVSKMWAYIRKHNLQDPQKKRMINADSVLLKIFNGKKVVDMFEMNKLIGSHLKK